MHISVYGKNSHCLRTSFVNLNLIFRIFSRINKSISDLCVCVCVCVCVRACVRAWVGVCVCVGDVLIRAEEGGRRDSNIFSKKVDGYTYFT